MNYPLSIVILFISALLLGLRHGIDWDHIAAISDITGSSGNDRQSLSLGSLYALGHASVIVILGLIAIGIGINLPDWVDTIMVPVVGITLITLGLWLIYSIVIHGKNYQMKSRWMIIFMLVGKFYDFLQEKVSHKHKHPHLQYPERYGVRTAFMVGVIHGIGAETPTQMLLFITAAGVGGTIIGLLLIFMFVSGLLISNSIITIVSSTGFSLVKNNPYTRVTLGLITAVFSLIVGTLFLLNKVTYLPTIIGG